MYENKSAESANKGNIKTKRKTQPEASVEKSQLAASADDLAEDDVATTADNTVAEQAQKPNPSVTNAAAKGKILAKSKGNVSHKKSRKR